MIFDDAPTTWMWRSQQVVILLVLRDRSILLLHLRGWRLDHFETKNLYTYDQRIKEWRFGSRSESLVVQKVRKKSRFKVVFIGKRIWQRSVAGPLKSWPAPLKLRGPPFIIKGAAQLKRPDSLSFSGESLFGEKLTDFG